MILFTFNGYCQKSNAINEGDKPASREEEVVCQLYPRSFVEGDGIGDLKLDYMKGIGSDALWLNPIFSSSNDDNLILNFSTRKLVYSIDKSVNAIDAMTMLNNFTGKVIFSNNKVKLELRQAVVFKLNRS
ncbi:MAG: hypothetical protein EOP55_00885 [Sphingobacteriales bacterium]|nr:MAG: hypothetical protein EOP55_00885 [Sphingobacteriales bacterium]